MVSVVAKVFRQVELLIMRMLQAEMRMEVEVVGFVSFMDTQSIIKLAENSMFHKMSKLIVIRQGEDRLGKIALGVCDDPRMAADELTNHVGETVLYIRKSLVGICCRPSNPPLACQFSTFRRPRLPQGVRLSLHGILPQPPSNVTLMVKKLVKWAAFSSTSSYRTLGTQGCGYDVISIMLA